MGSLLRLILVFIVGSKNYRAEETSEKCEDLSTSMNSILLLNQLVTELSVQVAKLTTSLAVLKVHGDETQKDLEKTQSKIAVLEDYAMRAMEKKIEKVTTSLSTVKEKVGETQKDMAVAKTKMMKVTTSLSTMNKSLLAVNEKVGETQKDMVVAKTKMMKVTTSLSTMKESLLAVNEKVGETQKDMVITKRDIANLEDKGLKGLQNQINQVITSVEKINAKVDDIEEDVIVVSGEEKAGPRKCMKVCAGTTGRTATNWVNYYDNGIYTDVDIRSCGFIKIPSVTTSIEGSTQHWTALGASSIYSTSKSKFRIYINYNKINPSGAKNRKWNVEWIAVGYTC